jgi:hypothetical protein
MFTLGFWLSASLVLDVAIVPSLWASGLMSQSGFVTASYLIFGLFNHIELVCAAVVLSGVLVLRRQYGFSQEREVWPAILSALLLAIALSYTYVLTPQLSGWGFSLPLFDTAPSMPFAMIAFQGAYWVLEAAKLLAGLAILRWCYRDTCHTI